MEFGCKFRHAILVLVVFLLLELQLLDVALCLLEGLVSFRCPGLDASKFNLKLSDARFQFGHGSATSLRSRVISFSQAVFKLSNLGLQRALSLILLGRVFLLRTKFISKSGSINHGLLGFLFRILGLMEHVINLSMHGVDGRLKVTLLGIGLRVDGGHVIDRSPCFRKFQISLFLDAISRVQQSTALFKLTLKGIGFAISKSSLLSNLLSLTALLLIELLSVSQLTLIPLDGLVSLSICLVGMVQSNLKLIDV